MNAMAMAVGNICNLAPQQSKSLRWKLSQVLKKARFGSILAHRDDHAGFALQ